MQIEYAGVTDVGLVRELNEDNYLVDEKHRLFVVADGMGGHQSGDVASRMATESVKQFFDITDSEDATWPFPFDPKLTFEQNRLATGVKFANKLIFEASLQDRKVHGMGTTIVAAYQSADGSKLHIAHVGDSRAYLLREERLSQLTRDHSLLNDYLSMMPNMSEYDQAQLPKNVITRALGMQDEVTVDLCSVDLRPGDHVLLCTDGLTAMVRDDQILRTFLGEIRTGTTTVRLSKSQLDAANQVGPSGHGSAMDERSRIGEAETQPIPIKPAEGKRAEGKQARGKTRRENQDAQPASTTGSAGQGETMEKSVQGIATSLVAQANDRGGDDNTTVILMQFS